jgi:hypothetical protein
LSRLAPSARPLDPAFAAIGNAGDLINRLPYDSIHARHRHGESGVAKRPGARKLRAAVDEFLAAIEVLAWTGATARRYGLIPAGLHDAEGPSVRSIS